jgi:hypothetical protein
VWRHTRRCVPDDVRPVALTRGLNVLVIKTVIDPEWELLGQVSRQVSVRLTQADGKPVPGMRVTLSP